MKNLIKIVFSIFLFINLLLFSLEKVSAQCPMCKSAVESDATNGGSVGKGLNNGILYLLVMPYLLVGSVGLIYYLNYRKKEKEKSL